MTFLVLLGKSMLSVKRVCPSQKCGARIGSATSQAHKQPSSFCCINLRLSNINGPRYEQELACCIMLVPTRASLQPNFVACLSFVLRVGRFQTYEVTGPFSSAVVAWA